MIASVLDAHAYDQLPIYPDMAGMFRRRDAAVRSEAGERVPATRPGSLEGEARISATHLAEAIQHQNTEILQK